MSKKEEYEKTIQDLLEESESDDSSDDNLDHDPELEKFKQKAGLAKYQSQVNQIDKT